LNAKNNSAININDKIIEKEIPEFDSSILDYSLKDDVKQESDNNDITVIDLEFAKVDYTLEEEDDGVMEVKVEDVDSIIQNQTNLNDFMDNNLDSIDIAVDMNKIADNIIKTNNTIKKDINLNNKNGYLTEYILENNIMKLEQLLSVSHSTDFPIRYLYDYIDKRLKISNGGEYLFKDNFNNYNDLAIIHYMNSHLSKFYIKNLLEHQQELPSSIYPISCITDGKFSDVKIDIIYDMLLYIIYYNQLKSILSDHSNDPYKNRSIMSLWCKLSLSPYVFSYFKNKEVLDNINVQSIVSEISRRYKQYNDNGVFASIKEDINDNFTQVNLSNINDVTIAVSVEKLLNSYIKNIDIMKLDNVYNTYYEPTNMKLKYEDFKDITNIHYEQIFNYLNLINNGISENIDIESVDSLPNKLLIKIGLGRETISIQNLERYIKNELNDEQEFNKIQRDILCHINMSYKDLKDKKVSVGHLPENVLIALCVWDGSDKNCVNNYSHMITLIRDSSLKYGDCVAMINNINDNIKEKINITDCMNIADLTNI